MKLDYGLLLTCAFLTGFIGDIILQILIKKYNLGDWGLKSYFIRHGSNESVFIAGGMLTLFYIIYLYIFRLPVKWYYLGLYGILLDLLFRKCMLFPSLQGYYTYLNYFWSAFWGFIPMILPLFLCKMIP